MFLVLEKGGDRWVDEMSGSKRGGYFVEVGFTMDNDKSSLLLKKKIGLA